MTAYYRPGGTSGNSGKIFVTSPIPFVRPSLNSSREPMLRYSGRLKNRNVTIAFSFVRMPPCQVTSQHVASCQLVLYLVQSWKWYQVSWNTGDINTDTSVLIYKVENLYICEWASAQICYG